LIDEINLLKAIDLKSIFVCYSQALT